MLQSRHLLSIPVHVIKLHVGAGRLIQCPIRPLDIAGYLVQLHSGKCSLINLASAVYLHHLHVHILGEIVHSRYQTQIHIRIIHGRILIIYDLQIICLLVVHQVVCPEIIVARTQLLTARQRLLNSREQILHLVIKR